MLKITILYWRIFKWQGNLNAIYDSRIGLRGKKEIFF